MYFYDNWFQTLFSEKIFQQNIALHRKEPRKSLKTALRSEFVFIFSLEKSLKRTKRKNVKTLDWSGDKGKR